jgi:hypothetical protein
MGLGIPQKLLPAKVSGYCFFRFHDVSFHGGVVSPTPNPQLSWREYESLELIKSENFLDRLIAILHIRKTMYYILCLLF